jgi:hypothetical protein
VSGLYKKSAFLDFTPGANKIYYYQPDCGDFTQNAENSNFSGDATNDIQI